MGFRLILEFKECDDVFGRSGPPSHFPYTFSLIFWAPDVRILIEIVSHIQLYFLHFSPIVHINLRFCRFSDGDDSFHAVLFHRLSLPFSLVQFMYARVCVYSSVHFHLQHEKDGGFSYGMELQFVV